MAEQTLKTTIMHRTDTSVNWTSKNPILYKGEIGYDTTEKKIKIGDGISTWDNLQYLGKLPKGGESGAYIIKNSDIDFDIKWQKPDNEPLENSENLITSGAVFEVVGNISSALDAILGV